MKVSIVTATFNSAKTVTDTIKSIIAQDYPDIEHIIVDGASKDNTLEIVENNRYRNTTVISEPDKGIYDAMNKGIKMAKGDIVGILNSDDFFASKDVVSRIVQEFQNDQSLIGVYSNLYYVKQNNPDSVSRHWVSRPFKENSFFKGWHPPHPTLYLRKEAYEKYGLFNLDFPLAADFELMLRFFERFKIKTKYIDYTTIRMRLGGATNKGWKNVKQQNLECMKAFKVNGLNPPVLYPLYRLIPKLFQFIR